MPGGQADVDYVAAASGSLPISGTGPTEFASTSEMIADVQAWLDDPSANFGWMVISMSEGIPRTAKRFGFLEHATSNVKSFLVVDYDVPPLTATVTATADTALWERNSEHNLGGMSFVPVGVVGGVAPGGERARGLFRFDLSGALPPLAVVNSATLTVQVVRESTLPPGNVELQLFRVLAEWDEGTKTGGGYGSGFLGAPATAGETTWTARAAPSTFWSVGGGEVGLDFESDASATATMGGLGSHSFESPTLVEDVQNWIENPGSNFGWVMAATDEQEPGTARQIASREDANPGIRPTLVIGYKLRPILNARIETGGPLPFPVFSLSFEGKAGETYLIQNRPSFGPDEWTDFRPFPPLLRDQQVIVSELLFGPVALSNAFYRVLIE